MTRSIQETLAQITKQPIAHRGLHDCANGIIENSSTAFSAAIDHGFGIEIDLRQTASNVPIVFHDADLERLTNGSGKVQDYTIAQLKKLSLKNSHDKIQTLAEFLEQINGQVPIVIEIKSQWQDGNSALEQEICTQLQHYQGAYSVMSFDNESIKAIKHYSPRSACGLLAGAFNNKKHWRALKTFSALEFYKMRHIMPALRQNFHSPKIDYIGYDVDRLPALAPWFAKEILGLPLLCWTVRSKKQQTIAQKWADAMIFEGFIPNQNQ